MTTDAVVRPSHYNWFGIECADVVCHFSFNVGSAIKYLWRNDKKNTPIENLRKARECIDMEIERLEADADGREFNNAARVARQTKHEALQVSLTHG